MTGQSTWHIRSCDEHDVPRILEIINEAAEAYRGVIPPDCWHEPYMTAEDLDRDIARGVSFSGLAVGDSLVGVMGLQTVGDADLIRHAYVLSAFQGQGIGAALMDHLVPRASHQLLVGTWADARWAIAFYQRRGFSLADPAGKDILLERYWTVPPRQREVSVVLVGSGVAAAGSGAPDAD